MTQKHNTWEAFLPLSVLAATKEKLKETISVVIPARNEAATIGAVVSIAKRFMDDTGIIDEVVVMDGSSDDATVSIARSAGARVEDVASVGPKIEVSGKGVALWKAQFVTTGSIIMFIDSDIYDFSERFLVGLAGAMLHNPALHLVKAAYRRPLIDGATEISDGGGRVTELLVRPLINLFWPDLSRIRQPLAGEYALRRRTIEKMPFVSGYGVEIGLLLETYFSMGKNAVGEVEVGERTHRNRPLNELSVMSFEIARVIMEYLARHDACMVAAPGATIMEVPSPEGWRTWQCAAVTLPPKNSIPWRHANGA